MNQKDTDNMSIDEIINKSGSKAYDEVVETNRLKEVDKNIIFSKIPGSFILICLLGGFLYYNIFRNYLHGPYQAIFWALFLMVSLFYLKKITDINLKNPIFIISTITLMLASLRMIFYSSPDINGMFFLMLPCLGVFTLLSTKDNFAGYNFIPVYETIMAMFFRPLISLIEIPSFLFKKRNLEDFKSSKSLDKDKSRGDIIKGVLIALPVLLILLSQLSSGDVNFRNFLNNFIPNLALNTETLTMAFGTIFFGVYYFCLFIGIASYRTKEIKEVKPRLNKVTTETILYSLIVLFSVYLMVVIYSALKFRTISGDPQAVSTFGRSGFFALIRVMLINLAVLVITDRYTDRRNEVKPSLKSALVIITIVLLILSFYKMGVYEAEYGLTTLRILVKFAHTFILCLLIGALVFINRSNFNITGFALSSAMILIMVLSLLNTDAIIAKSFSEIKKKTGKYDSYYVLMNSSSDSIYPLIESFSLEDENVRKTAVRIMDGLRKKKKDPLKYYSLTFTERKMLMDPQLLELEESVEYRD